MFPELIALSSVRDASESTRVVCVRVFTCITHGHTTPREPEITPVLMQKLFKESTSIDLVDVTIEITHVLCREC